MAVHGGKIPPVHVEKMQPGTNSHHIWDYLHMKLHSQLPPTQKEVEGVLRGFFERDLVVVAAGLFVLVDHLKRNGVDIDAIMEE